MPLQQEIQTRSVTRREAEARLEKYKKKFDAAAVRYSKTSYLELSARLLGLPLEIRDLIYDDLWSHRCDWDENVFIERLVPTAYLSNPPPHCSNKLASTDYCVCSAHVPDFVKRDLLGEHVASEVLEAFRARIRWRISERDRPQYCLHWSKLEAFATRDLFHLGVTLHELFEGMRLVLVIDCLDATNGARGLETLGIPGGVNDQLRRFVQALLLLRHEKPRHVTFAFRDQADGVPSNMEHVFRSLSMPFRELKNHGFDVRVEYVHHDGGMGSSLGIWDLGSDAWECRRSDVWEWRLYDWKMNFTRCNNHFQGLGGMGELFIPCPNGPVDAPWRDYRAKLPVWEGIRRYLFRVHPEVERVVTFMRDKINLWYKRRGLELFVDCGCAPGKHTCSDYFLCDKHGGWDDKFNGPNTQCYKCAGIVAPG